MSDLPSPDAFERASDSLAYMGIDIAEAFEDPTIRNAAEKLIRVEGELHEEQGGNNNGSSN